MTKHEIITVNFVTGNNTFKDYDFKNYIEGLKIGDLVVVDTVHGYCVAKIKRFKEISNETISKYVVQKIDLTAHQERLEKDKKIAEVKAKMEARRKKVQELEIYRILAKEDDEMAELLEELDSINQ